jgi:hypothetical protein
MNTRRPYSKIGPDADFISAGDEVVSLDDGDLEAGILADVENGEATIRYANGDWAYVPFDRVAHADSPQAEAVAMFGKFGNA